MSLLARERMFAGHDQADIASLEADGNFYRCYVYLNRAQWRVEATCLRVQPNGKTVHVFSNVIAEATATEVADTNGIPLDCPKIIASGTTFVVHWLQADDIPTTTRNWELYRASMDMESFSSTAWTSHGATSLLVTHLLYDVCAVIGSTEFIVAKYAGTDDIDIERYNGLDWIDTAWSVSLARTINPTVLSVYAHEDDADVLVTYEVTSSGFLITSSLSASAGAHNGTQTTFVDTPNGTFAQVGHCRTAANRVAVVAEFCADVNIAAGAVIVPYGWIHAVAYRMLNSSTADLVGNEHYATDLYMASRPWAYTNGAVGGATSNVCVLLTFKSIMQFDDWSQYAAFVCNLDSILWSTFDSGTSVRPRPICTVYTPGVPDCRASGWRPGEGGDTALHAQGPTKRSNHLSHASGAPPFGPDVKTRTIATIMFSALRAQSALEDPTDTFHATNNPYFTSLQPERAGVRGLLVYLEDPWTVYRDPSDPTQPDTNFQSEYSRSMHQSVQAGQGLFISGGTPQIYDGRRVVECGFPWRPEIIYSEATESMDATATLAPGFDYFSYAVFTWTDGAGQTHRSGPSDVVTTTVLGAENRITYNIRGVSISQKDSEAWHAGAQAIQIEIYRTNSTLDGNFYRVYGTTEVGIGEDYRPRDTPINQFNANNTGATVFDGVRDEQLELQGNGPYQYVTGTTFGGPLPSAVPAMTVVASWQNRTWGVDALDPTVVYYSDELIPEPGATFYSVPIFDTAAQLYRIGDIGEITGMIPMNNAMIVFTRSSVWSLIASNAGTAISPGLMNVQAELLHEGTGCIEPRSLVLTPLGVMFQSAKGYYMLSRSRELGYYSLARSRDDAFSTSGSEVEDDLFEGGNIRSAVLLGDRPQVRVVTNGRPVIQQTWTFNVSVGIGPGSGTWAIVGLGASVTVPFVEDAAAATVADSFDTLITTLRATSLRFVVQSVTSPGNTVVVTLLPGVDLALTTGDPNPGTLTAAVVETLTRQPRVLIYDYILQKWSRAELPEASAVDIYCELVDGTAWHGDTGSLHVALAQGAVFVERTASDPDAYADEAWNGDVGIPIDITTSWILISGIGGYIRLRSIGIQTERHDDEAMHVDLEYDRSGTYLGGGEGLDIEPSTYDWTSPAPSYLRVRPREQKVSAVRVRVYEASSVAAGQNVSIIGLVFDVGVKPGMKRVGDAQIGST